MRLIQAISSVAQHMNDPAQHTSIIDATASGSTTPLGPWQITPDKGA
jgi:hypothetical protein